MRRDVDALTEKAEAIQRHLRAIVRMATDVQGPWSEDLYDHAHAGLGEAEDGLAKCAADWSATAREADYQAPEHLRRLGAT